MRSGGNRQESIIAIGHQEPSPALLHYQPIVVITADLHVRSAENEEMQPSLPLGCDIEFCVHQQTAQVRIADDHLLDGVAPIWVRIGDLKTQTERAEAVEVGCHVAALIVESVSPSVTRNCRSRI